jgi:HSP20 family protein
LIKRYKEEVERFVDRLNRSFFENYSRPKSNISQNLKHVIVNIELPGVQKDEINLHISKSKIDLHTQKKVEKTRKKKDSIETQIKLQGFHRVIKLPPNLEINNAEAKWNHDRLIIKIPKSKQNVDEQGKLEIK